jgi:hypothetical protein
MKRGLLLLTAVVSLVVLTAASAAEAKVHKQIRYVRIQVTSGFYVDNDPSGPSGGDLFGSTGDLTHNGGKVGTFSTSCESSSAEVGQCNVTFTWNNGDRLQLAGEIRLQQSNNELSIVGGTGRYKKARGDARLTQLDDAGEVQRVRLRIILSP